MSGTRKGIDAAALREIRKAAIDLFFADRFAKEPPTKLCGYFDSNALVTDAFWNKTIESSYEGKARIMVYFQDNPAWGLWPPKITHEYVENRSNVFKVVLDYSFGIKFKEVTVHFKFAEGSSLFAEMEIINSGFL